MIRAVPGLKQGFPSTDFPNTIRDPAEGNPGRDSVTIPQHRVALRAATPGRRFHSTGRLRLGLRGAEERGTGLRGVLLR